MPRPQPANPWARWALDTLERTARTFLQGALAVLTADQLTGLDAGLRDALVVAAIAGAYAVVSSFVAKPTGATDSASFLPAHTDPPQP